MASTFAHEVLQGLQAEPKYLPSKYFYNETGDRLFQQIMAAPEYYLTRCEADILTRHAASLQQLFSPHQEPFDLIELGAGDGLKTKILLRTFLAGRTPVRYLPLDISAHALRKLEQTMQQAFPELQIESVCNDYFQGLDQISSAADARKVVLFLGSSIGNMSDEEANQFLAELGRHLSTDDMLLIGFDLVKDPGQLLAAYNDAAGITGAFNLNLLQRINDQLGADFDLGSFRHFPLYDPVRTEARSYLISTRKQTVHFPRQHTSISFAAWEAIHTEISRKYTPEAVEAFAEASGFEVVQHFRDEQNCFLDSVWRKS